jgi:hypothetical protein
MDAIVSVLQKYQKCMLLHLIVKNMRRSKDILKSGVGGVLYYTNIVSFSYNIIGSWISLIFFRKYTSTVQRNLNLYVIGAN